MAGTLTIDTLKASSGVLATQNGMTGIAKAWVNFNGTNGTINGTSFNVSSVTRNGTGDYTITFTTAMANTYYSVGGNAMRNQANGNNLTALSIFPSTTYSDAFISTTQFRCVTQDYGGGKQDALAVTVQAFSA